MIATGASDLRQTPIRLLLALMAVSAGCDGMDPVQLVEEIDAAREGCTQEALKTSDEACVEMFDTYAEMGEGAIESYIGGMKAMDEALKRRGGIRFDTAGLGHAITDSLLGGALEGPLAAPEAPELCEYDSEPLLLDRSGSTGGAGGWETAADRDARLGPDVRRDDAAGDLPRSIDRTRRPAVREADVGPASRRGVLRPPEERLRRPWIGDEDAPAPYVDAGGRRSAPPPDRAEPGRDTSWDRPEETIPPDLRE